MNTDINYGGGSTAGLLAKGASVGPSPLTVRLTGLIQVAEDTRTSLNQVRGHSFGYPPPSVGPTLEAVSQDNLSASIDKLGDILRDIQSVADELNSRI